MSVSCKEDFNRLFVFSNSYFYLRDISLNISRSFKGYLVFASNSLFGKYIVPIFSRYFYLCITLLSLGSNINAIAKCVGRHVKTFYVYITPICELYEYLQGVLRWLEFPCFHDLTNWFGA